MNSYYKHTNGCIFRVLQEGKHAITGEVLLVYQAMFDNGEIWILPKKTFIEGGEFVNVSESEAVFGDEKYINDKTIYDNIIKYYRDEGFFAPNNLDTISWGDELDKYLNRKQES